MRAALCVLCMTFAFAAPQKPSDVYESAIAKYVAGDLDAALNALARVPQDTIQTEVDTYVSAVRSHYADGGARRRLEAMAMVHTEYGVTEQINPKQVLFHIDMAHRALSIARETVTVQKPGTNQLELQRAREFLPRWYPLAASVLLTYAADRNAIAIIDEGLRLFPGDGRLLLWRGLALEFHAVWVGTPMLDPQAAVPGLQANTRLWTTVEEAYRHAVDHDPADFEAHLHLGYSFAALGRDDDAAIEYERARDGSSDPFVVYVADLLLARLKEDRNDLEGAVQEYDRALAIIPGAQNAYIGLGLLEARRGHSQRARELTLRLAAIPEKQRVRDPWWGYRSTRVPIDDLHWLRAAVRQ